MKQIRLIILPVMLGIIPLTTLSQFNETKKFTKRYSILPETRIEISNKYGNIVINTWDKDSVVFEVNLRVEEKRLSRLEKRMDEIDFEFTNSSHFLIARTILNKTKSALEKELLRFKESILSDDGAIEINYEVWLPDSCELIIDNKYGNIFMSDFFGESKVTLSNGKLKAHNLLGYTIINLNFADATINELTSASLTANYSDIEIESVSQLKIDSKQSTYEVTEVADIDINSRRDKFRIKKAMLIDADGSFTSFRINELTNRANLNGVYGDIDIEKINPGFSLILIESKSSDINLYFEPGTNFGFELTKTKTTVNLCREIEITKETTLDEKNKTVKINGKYGTKEGSSEKLIINANSGNVNIFSN